MRLTNVSPERIIENSMPKQNVSGRYAAEDNAGGKGQCDRLAHDDDDAGW